MPAFDPFWYYWTDQSTQTYLNRVADRLRDRGSSDVARELVSSDEATGQVILAYAQRSGANMIAIAARRQSGLPGFFRRERAEYLIRGGMIPVLIARTDADERRPATTSVKKQPRDRPAHGDARDAVE